MDTKAELLMLKGAIYDLPAQSQENIKKHSDFFKAYLTEHGEEAMLGFACLALELQDD